MTDTTTSSYLIPESRLEGARRELDRMVRKASRLGVDSISYGVGTGTDQPMTRDFSGSHRFQGSAKTLKDLEDSGQVWYVRFVEVTVTGPAPVLGGWEFVATLEHLQDDSGKPMNILRVRPGLGAVLPERFRTVTASTCDHCHQLRNRKDTYVVRNVATGAWLQVGSTCIKDFTGGLDPRAMLAALEWSLNCDEVLGGDDDGGFGEGSGVEVRWSLREFMATVAATARQEGWMPRSRAQDEGKAATADLVIGYLLDKREAARVDALNPALDK